MILKKGIPRYGFFAGMVINRPVPHGRNGHRCARGYQSRL